MKYSKTYIIFIQATFFALLPLASCKVSNTITGTSTNNEITIESPKIIFLNYSIVKDTIQQDYRIHLINKIVTEGRIKENTIMTKTPATGDLGYTILNNESQVLMHNYIANPLNRTVEYVTNNRQLAKKDIQLDSTQFSLRIPLAPTAQFISIERYTGLDSGDIRLLISDILKKEQE